MVVLIRDMLLPMIGLGTVALILSLVGALSAYILIGIIIAVAVIDGIIFAYYLSVSYRLTTKRIESRAGILAVSREEIYLEEVQSVDTKKSFWGMIFNFGDVIVEAAGHNTITLSRISNMRKIASMIGDLSVEHARRKGVKKPDPQV